MKNEIQNQIQLYKQIESICVLNNSIWNHVPEFRGAFSRFALKVAQLDLLHEGEMEKKSAMEKLVSDIETILHRTFDRFFDFLKNKHRDLYCDYKTIRNEIFN